jgi:hypothetical protein
LPELRAEKRIQKGSSILNIIGIAGRAGAGKDTVADILVREHGFVKIALADPLKRACKEFFNFTDEQLWGPSEERNKPDERYPRNHSWPNGFFPTRCLCCNALEGYEPERQCYLTPRFALQQLGTEYGRAMFENVWIDKAIETARLLFGLDAPFPNEKSATIRGYDPRRGLIASYNLSRCRGVVISDVRFFNELTRIRDVGGRVWYRSGTSLIAAAASHSSETSLPKELASVGTAIEWEPDLKKLSEVVGILMEETPR